MKVCLMIEGQEGVTWPQWVALARAAEEAQLDALFRSDHYRAIGRGDPNGALDAWGTICALAAITSTLKLGTLVTPVTFRKPSVLAKLVTTADHISGGRVELGLGAGWFESEHIAYGFDFMTTTGRLDELEEQLRAYADAGVERVMLQHLQHEDVERVAVLGEVASRLR